MVKEPETLCNTCQDQNGCGSNSRHIIDDDDIARFSSMGVKVKVAVYACESYKRIPKEPKTKGEQIGAVLSEIDRLRGYRAPKRNAEAASIMRMLKNYTIEQITETWQKMKQDKFWQDKELFLMSVESQIGAILKNGTSKTNPRAIKNPNQYTLPDALRHG